MDCLHWQCLLAKLSVTATCDSHLTALALSNLGGMAQIGSFLSVALPKVSKPSTSVSLSLAICHRGCRPTFANVNMANLCCSTQGGQAKYKCVCVNVAWRCRGSPALSPYLRKCKYGLISIQDGTKKYLELK
jgi:hypothetical protein